VCFVVQQHLYFKVSMSAGNPNDDFDDELLSAYVDGELTAAERALVDERLRSDPAAAALVEELRGLSSAIKSLPPQTLGRDLRAGVLAEIDEARADLAKRGPATLTAPPVDRRAGMRRGLIWSAMAIAAAVLVALFQPAEIVQEERELARAEQDKLRESTAVKKVAPEESKSELADVGGGLQASGLPRSAGNSAGCERCVAAGAAGFAGRLGRRGGGEHGVGWRRWVRAGRAVDGAYVDSAAIRSRIIAGRRTDEVRRVA
jgi:negative regulator of sigma E activity